MYVLSNFSLMLESKIFNLVILQNSNLEWFCVHCTVLLLNKSTNFVKRTLCETFCENVEPEIWKRLWICCCWNPQNLKPTASRQLKVRKSRNDFFKQTFPPKKNKDSILLLWELFSSVFWRKLKTPKRLFEINWTLVTVF